MNEDCEVIAVVLDEQNEADVESAAETTGAHKLIREADGRVALEPVVTEEDLVRMAKDTGCFRRGRPIRDPNTGEVIGYELEEVSRTLAVIAR